MLLNDKPQASELNIGDTIAVPGSTGYNYETKSWPHPDEVPSFPGEIEHVALTGHGGWYVRGVYLDDHQEFFHLMTMTGTVTRIRKAA